jgi:hypothetical protein
MACCVLLRPVMHKLISFLMPVIAIAALPRVASASTTIALVHPDDVPIVVQVATPRVVPVFVLVQGSACIPGQQGQPPDCSVTVPLAAPDAPDGMSACWLLDGSCVSTDTTIEVDVNEGATVGLRVSALSGVARGILRVGTGTSQVPGTSSSRVAAGIAPVCSEVSDDGFAGFPNQVTIPVTLPADLAVTFAGNGVTANPSSPSPSTTQINATVAASQQIGLREVTLFGTVGGDAGAVECPIVVDNEAPIAVAVPSSQFVLRNSTVNIPITLTRAPGINGPVSLSVTPNPGGGISASIVNGALRLQTGGPTFTFVPVTVTATLLLFNHPLFSTSDTVLVRVL